MCWRESNICSSAYMSNRYSRAHKHQVTPWCKVPIHPQGQDSAPSGSRLSVHLDEKIVFDNIFYNKSVIRRKPNHYQGQNRDLEQFFKLLVCHSHSQRLQQSWKTCKLQQLVFLRYITLIDYNQNLNVTCWTAKESGFIMNHDLVT